jgi:hypothetical protein
MLEESRVGADRGAQPTASGLTAKDAEGRDLALALHEPPGKFE